MRPFTTQEPVLKKIYVYIFVCCLSFAMLIGFYVTLDSRVSYYTQQESNTRAKNTISLFIQKRVLLFQNQFQSMVLASSRGEFELANRRVKENLEIIKNAVQVLEKGGIFKDALFVNFGNKEYIEQSFAYIPPVDNSISLSAIEMKTNLIRLADLREENYNLIVTYLDWSGSGQKAGHDSRRTLSYKKITPFFQRIIENSNRLYFESLNTFDEARLKMEAQIDLFRKLAGIVSAMAFFFVIAVGLWIRKGIEIILEERHEAQAALLSANENLETQVLERTQSLEDEIIERRDIEINVSRQARFLTTVIEALNHPFYVIDIETHEIKMSNQAARSLCHEPKKYCYELTHHRDSPCGDDDHPCPIQVVKSTKQHVVMEHLHYNSENEPIYVEVHGYPIFDEYGEVIQMIEYALDITEKKNAQLALAKSHEQLEEIVVRRTRNLEVEISKREKFQCELEHSERHFRKLIEGINDVILITGKDGLVSFVSPSVKKVLGYEPKDILGQKLFQFIHSDEFPTERSFLEKFFTSSRDSYIAENRVCDNFGKFRIMESSIKFMMDDPDINGVIFTSRDVTERKEIEQMQKKLLLAVEQNPNSVVITDIHGTIEYVNPAFEQVTGYTYDEAIGQNPRILNSGKIPAEKFQEMWASLEKGLTWKGEFINKKKSGELYNENVVLVPLKDNSGVLTHYVAIKENITELIEAREQAEAATKAKSEFLAMMSHEIRTPMNAIIGMSHLALTTNLSPKQNDYITKIETSSKSLLAIINSILDFSKVEAHGLELENIEFELHSVVQQVSDIISVHTPGGKGLEILFDVDPDIPDRLVGDPLRFKQILVNLAGNAVKFTERGEVIISLALQGLTTHGITIEASVKDTGIGMSDQQIDNLFQPFSQADTSTTRKYGGTGLGLTISMGMIELMNGELRVKSAPGEGSEFIFTVDFGRGTVKTVPGGSGEIEILAKRRALIVAENPSAGGIIREMLEAFGCRADNARSGEDGVELFKEALNNTPYDIVLVDQKLPGIDGLETGILIMSISKHNPVHMLLMAGPEHSDIDATALYRNGFLGILAKPVLASSLLDSVGKALKGHPVENDETVRRQISPDWLKPVRGASVLLVDDNLINQQVADEVLKQAGFFVTIASNGRIAVDLLETRAFDIILMDLHMPVMDGLQATREIRTRYAPIPIIAMTAGAMDEDRERALQAGMNDYISKPLDIQLFLRKLLKWIPEADRELPPGFRSEEESVTAAEFSMGKLEWIDTGAGLAHASGNQDVYDRILSTFSRTHGATFQNLTGAIHEGDFSSARHMVHQLRGEAGNIGAKGLYGHASELEQILASPEPRVSEKILVRFGESLERVLGSLAACSFFDQPDMEENRAGNRGSLDQLAHGLNTLRPFLRQGNLKNSVSVIGSFKNDLWPPHVHDQIKTIDGFVSRYRFDDALESMDILLEKITAKD